MSAYKKNTKCPACNKQTFGVFNTARKLLRKLGLAEVSSKGSTSTEGNIRKKKGTWETES